MGDTTVNTETDWGWARCAEWLHRNGCEFAFFDPPPSWHEPLRSLTKGADRVRWFGIEGQPATDADWRAMLRAWCEVNGRTVPWEEAEPPAAPEPDWQPSPEWLRHNVPLVVQVTTLRGATAEAAPYGSARALLRLRVDAAADAWQTDRDALAAARAGNVAMNNRRREIARDNERLSKELDAAVEHHNDMRDTLSSALELVATGRVTVTGTEETGWSAHIPCLNMHPATGPNLAQCVLAAWSVVEDTQESAIALDAEHGPSPDLLRALGFWECAENWQAALDSNAALRAGLEAMSKQRDEARENEASEDRWARQYRDERDAAYRDRDAALALAIEEEAKRKTAERERDSERAGRTYCRNNMEHWYAQHNEDHWARIEAEKDRDTARAELAAALERAEAAEKERDRSRQDEIRHDNDRRAALAEAGNARAELADLRSSLDDPEAAVSQLQVGLRLANERLAAAERERDAMRSQRTEAEQVIADLRAITRAQGQVFLYEDERTESYSEPVWYWLHSDKRSQTCGRPGQPWTAADVHAARVAVCGEEPESPEPPSDLPRFNCAGEVVVDGPPAPQPARRCETCEHESLPRTEPTCALCYLPSSPNPERLNWVATRIAPCDRCDGTLCGPREGLPNTICGHKSGWYKYRPKQPSHPCSTCRHQRGHYCNVGENPQGPPPCPRWQAVDEKEDEEPSELPADVARARLHNLSERSKDIARELDRIADGRDEWGGGTDAS